MGSDTIEVFADERVKPSIDKVTILGRSSLNIICDDIFELVAKNGDNQFLCEEYFSEKEYGYKKGYKISYRRFYNHGSFEIHTLFLLIGKISQGACNTLKHQREFRIEYNPNKFKVPKWLASYFLRRKYVAKELKNIDLCFDFIGFEKYRFGYVVSNANTKVMSIGTQNNLTDYIGISRKSANRIKIYDKKKERKPYYDLENETTRVEVTLDWKYYVGKLSSTSFDIKCLTQASKALEQVFIRDVSTNDAVFYALSCLSSDELNTALSLMHRHTRQKYKSLLTEQTEYKLYCNTLMLREFLYRQLTDVLFCAGISQR